MPKRVAVKDTIKLTWTDKHINWRFANRYAQQWMDKLEDPERRTMARKMWNVYNKDEYITIGELVNIMGKIWLESALVLLQEDEDDDNELEWEGDPEF